MGDPDVDAVNELFYGYPDTMCARLAAGRNGATEEALCHWNAALLYDPDNLKAREGWLGAGNESATSAARSVRKLTRMIGAVSSES
jgi:hypothetical protein